jgi:outer membrane protein
MFSSARIRGAQVAFLLLAPAALLQAQAIAPAKIAYVDSRYILNGAPATPAAQAVLQKEESAAAAVAQRMSDSLDAMVAAFSKVQATLSADKRDQQTKAINDRQGEYQQRYQGMQQMMQDRQAEVMQPILDQVKIALEDVRVEMGLTMILDISQSGVLVAADKNLNVSDRVLAKLRTMPVPAIAEKKAADPKAAGKAPLGGPVQGPAGIGSKSKVPAKGDSVPPKKPDSTGTKRPDSAASKRPDLR